MVVSRTCNPYSEGFVAAGGDFADPTAGDGSGVEDEDVGLQQDAWVDHVDADGGGWKCKSCPRPKSHGTRTRPDVCEDCGAQNKGKEKATKPPVQQRLGGAHGDDKFRPGRPTRGSQVAEAAKLQGLNQEASDTRNAANQQLLQQAAIAGNAATTAALVGAIQQMAAAMAGLVPPPPTPPPPGPPSPGAAPTGA